MDETKPRRVKRQKGGKFAPGTPSPNAGGRPKSNAEIRELARGKAGDAVRILGEVLEGQHGAGPRERVAAAGQILLWAGGRPPSSAEVDAAEKAAAGAPQAIRSWEDLVAAAAEPVKPPGLDALSDAELEQLKALRRKMDGHAEDAKQADVLRILAGAGGGALESVLGAEAAAEIREALAQESGLLQPAALGEPVPVLVPDEVVMARLVPEVRPERLLGPAVPQVRLGGGPPRKRQRSGWELG